MATVTSAVNNSCESIADALETAISLRSGNTEARYGLDLPADQRAAFLIGWSACAEAVRRERMREASPMTINVSMPTAGDSIREGINDALADYYAAQKGPAHTGFAPSLSVEVRPASMAPGAARYRKPRRKRKAAR